MIREIADVRLPDSAICRAAYTLAEEASAPFLFNHVLRTYAFGFHAGTRAGLSFDPELFFLGAVLHDLGLTHAHRGDDRFDIDGADAAAAFLRDRGYDEALIDVVWDAIALHSTPAIPQRKQPEIALVQTGAGIDVGALPPDLLAPGVLERVVEDAPRLGFKQAMLAAIAEVVRDKPMTTALNFTADIAARHIDGFHRIDFCDAMEAAPFSE